MIYFQLPFESTIYTILPSAETNTIQFHSFDGQDTIEFSGTLKEVSLNAIETKIDLDEDRTNFSAESESDYLIKLQNLILDIQNKDLPKVVLSRRKIIENTSEINIQDTFKSLCESYPNAFKYIFLKDGISWTGAFSEVLGKYNISTEEFETMSLAGTLPKDEAWTNKEIEEQKPVTSYIADVLKNYSEQVWVSKTYDHISGNIKHLRTDFKMNVPFKNLEAIIAELHPTPAVCGIPKDECKKLISAYETYPREFYAGYNQVQIGDTVYYFVNLRCARLFKDTTHLFVGGGITAKSHPEKEWQETELKAQAVSNNLKFLS